MLIKSARVSDDGDCSCMVASPHVRAYKQPGLLHSRIIVVWSCLHFSNVKKQVGCSRYKQGNKHEPWFYVILGELQLEGEIASLGVKLW